MLKGTLPPYKEPEESRPGLTTPKTPAGIRQPTITEFRERAEEREKSKFDFSDISVDRFRKPTETMGDIPIEDHFLFIGAGFTHALIERPIKGLASLAAKGSSFIARKLGFTDLAGIYAEASEVLAAEEYGLLSPHVAKEKERRAIAASNSGLGWSVANSLVNAGLDFCALVVHMKTLNPVGAKSVLAPYLVRAGVSTQRALQVGTYTQRAAKLATYRFATTPSTDMRERGVSAAWMLAYNSTPYLATGIMSRLPMSTTRLVPGSSMGMKAFFADSVINSTLSTPAYISLGNQYGWFSEDFLTQAIPNLVMDIGMAWQTRNFPLPDRDREIYRAAERTATLAHKERGGNLKEMIKEKHELYKSLNEAVDNYDNIYAIAHLSNRFGMEVRLDNAGRIAPESMKDINAKTGWSLKTGYPKDVLSGLQVAGLKFDEKSNIFRNAQEIREEHSRTPLDHRLKSRRLVANVAYRRMDEVNRNFKTYPQSEKVMNLKPINSVMSSAERSEVREVGKLGDYVQDAELRGLLKDVLDTRVVLDRLPRGVDGAYKSKGSTDLVRSQERAEAVEKLEILRDYLSAYPNINAGIRPDEIPANYAWLFGKDNILSVREVMNRIDAEVTKPGEPLKEPSIIINTGSKLSQSRIIDALLEEAIHAKRDKLGRAFTREDASRLGKREYRDLPEEVSAKAFLEFARGRYFMEPMKPDAVDYKGITKHIKKEPVKEVKPGVRPKETVDTKIELIEKGKGAEAQAKILLELDTAQKGERIHWEEADGTRQTIGVDSSFPRWVPKELRSKKLFESVLDHIYGGTMPTKVNEVRLYNLVAEQLGLKEAIKDFSKEVGIDASKIFAETKINEQFSKISPKEKERVASEIERLIREATREAEVKELKTIIREKTGIVKDPTLKAFTQRMRDFARGAREGAMGTKEAIRGNINRMASFLEREKVPKEEIHRFITDFKNVTPTNLERNLPKITEKARYLIEKQQRKALIKEIEDTLPPKRKISKRGVREGRYYEAENIFSFLKGYRQMYVEDNKVKFANLTAKQEKGQGLHLFGSRTDAINEITRIIDAAGTIDREGSTPELTRADRQRISLLNMVGIQKMSSYELEGVRDQIKALKEKGRLLAEIRDINRDAELNPIKEEAKASFKTAKPVKVVIGENIPQRNPIARTISSIMDAMYGARHLMEKLAFEKDFKVADWGMRSIAKARDGSYEMMAKHHNLLHNKIKEIYKTDNVGKTMSDLTKPKDVFSMKDVDGKELSIKLSQAEAGYWWGQLRDPSQTDALLKTFVKGFRFSKDQAVHETEATRVANLIADKINSYTSKEMKELIDYMQFEWFKGIRKDGVEQRFLEKFGTDMPQNPWYLPKEAMGVKGEDLTNLLMGQAFPGFASTIPGGVKERTPGTMFRKADIFQVAQNHLNQMSQFVHFDKAVSNLRAVFLDKDVVDVIIASGNRDTHNVLIKKIDDIARAGKATNMHIRFLDNIVGRFMKSTLMFNMVPFCKQLTSLPAGLMGRDGLSAKDWASGSIEFFRNPVQWTKFFTENSSFIEQRVMRGWNRETALAFKQGNDKYFTKELGLTMHSFITRGMVTPTRAGDMFPILPNLTAKYLETYNKLNATGKYTKEQAHNMAIKKAEDLISNTQQSPLPEHMARIQMMNSITGAMTMYATTPIQYYRETFGTIRMAQRGQVGWDKAIQTFLVGHFVLPMLFQFVSDGFQVNTDRQKRAAILGSFNYIPAAGNMMETMYNILFLGETWRNFESGVTPLMSLLQETGQITELVYRLKNTDVRDRNKAYQQLARKIYDLTAKLTGRLPTAAGTTATGAHELLIGETDDFRRLIWGSYSLRKPEKLDSYQREIQKRLDELKSIPKSKDFDFNFDFDFEL